MRAISRSRGLRRTDGRAGSSAMRTSTQRTPSTCVSRITSSPGVVSAGGSFTIRLTRRRTRPFTPALGTGAAPAGGARRLSGGLLIARSLQAWDVLRREGLGPWDVLAGLGRPRTAWALRTDGVVILQEWPNEHQHFLGNLAAPPVAKMRDAHS